MLPPQIHILIANSKLNPKKILTEIFVFDFLISAVRIKVYLHDTRIWVVRHKIRSYDTNLKPFYLCSCDTNWVARHKIHILCKYPISNAESAYCRRSNKNLQMVEAGVDVMITIFCDFCRFSAEKWRFSQKPML
jgi:hypothetical protein